MSSTHLSGPDTLAMTVKNVTFLMERLSEDCHPLQFLRELTQNAIEGIQNLPRPKGEIVWDTDWNHHTLTSEYKLAVIDTGTGMTGEEMLQYINALSSSLSEQSIQGNYGIGAKIAAAPRNKAGLVYLSWKEGIGHMIHLWQNPETGIYGARQFQRPDGSYGHWAYVEDDVKPSQIKDHGTMVVLLGPDANSDTMQPPIGTASPSRWIARYLNTRYFRFPSGITVRAREGWEFPRNDSDRNLLRTVTGMQLYLEKHFTKSGTVDLTDAVAHWWILKDEDALSQNSGFIASSGHVAALYQDELYEIVAGRAGTARLQAFGVIFGHNRVVIYVEPKSTNGRRLTSNTARTELIRDGEPLPWDDWASEFRGKMPEDIRQLVDEVAGGSPKGDFQQAIKERLKQIQELFKLSRFRPVVKGSQQVEEGGLGLGGVPESKSQKHTSGGGSGGGRGGQAGNIYSLFLASRGIPAEEVSVRQFPEVRWINASDKTRTPPDLDDRAARYIVQDNLILANGDFRVFMDMVERWIKQYSHVPGARPVVEQVVREWFSQQLVETIVGLQALRDARHWSIEDLRQAWSEEALTAAVMPRWHVDVNIKRHLGAKLGSLKERIA
jgi:hypothetical protein